MNRQGEDSRRKRRRNRKILGIVTGILVTAAVGTGLGYTALRLMDTTSSEEPTLPQMLTDRERSPVPQAAVQETETSGEKQSVLTETEGSSREGQPEEERSEEELSLSGREPVSAPDTGDSGSAAEETQPEPQTEAIPEDPSVHAAETSAPVPETPAVLSADELRRREALSGFTNLGVVVNVKNYLNLRSQPTTNSEVCGIIFPNCGLEVLEDAGNGWIRISSGGVTGYVAQQFVLTGPEAEKLAMEHCRYQAEVLVDRLDVMSAPSTSSDLITSIIRGDRFDILSEQEGWVEIEIAEDRGGYINAGSVNTAYHLEEAIVFGFDASVSQKRRDIINTGLEYYGGKYVFGGESLTGGIDCSAYTEQIYGMNGITIPRNSWTQAASGKHVDEKDIRPGDLTFYYAAHRTGIGHVAIYIGNGKILHAASERKGITVSDWKYVPIVEIRNVIGD